MVHCSLGILRLQTKMDISIIGLISSSFIIFIGPVEEIKLSIYRRNISNKLISAYNDKLRGAW